MNNERSYTAKISANSRIFCGEFYIFLREPVPCRFVSVNGRNNEAQAHVAMCTLIYLVFYFDLSDCDGWVSTADIPSYLAPAKMWSSPSPDVAIRGHNKTLKCIFSGLYVIFHSIITYLDYKVEGKV